ncbi:MAG: hypothetical protein GY795_15270 [Desulfobacterales bacterium]|nr:hypothetical protein [Desulfobacterales bacterium]
MKFWQYTQQTLPKFHFGTPLKVSATFGQNEGCQIPNNKVRHMEIIKPKPTLC